MTAEDWKTRSEAAWHITATIGLILGGIWTIATFDVLHQKQRAQGELNKLKAEERELHERVQKNTAVSAEISAAPFLTHDGAQYISVTTSVRNGGNKPAVVNLDGPPIKVALADFDQETGAMTLRESVPGHIYIIGTVPLDAPGFALMAGEVRNFRTLVPVKKPGLYSVSFFAYRPKSEEERAIEVGMPPGERAALYANQFVTVSPVKNSGNG